MGLVKTQRWVYGLECLVEELHAQTRNGSPFALNGSPLKVCSSQRNVWYNPAEFSVDLRDTEAE